MCGILALARPETGRAPTDMLRRATRVVRHRGPDDEGYLLWSAGRRPEVYADDETADGTREAHALRVLPSVTEWRVGLGHRRLSIVDLSPAGHQPMVHEPTGIAIVYNGEIYNHIELRAELAGLGHRFTSHSDTEVLLAAWAQWGVASLHRLNGMFAFVLLDPRDGGTIHAVRDRFGVKPLYWARVGDVLAFASEIKQLRTLPGFVPRVNESAVYDYLAHSFVDHGTATFDRSVWQLRGGERASVALSDSRLTVAVHRWYDLAARVTSADDGVPGRVRDLLSDSVRLRLRADVPIGSCLSGGLDSSAIVCLARRALSAGGAHAGQITVTARFDDPRFDEWKFASEVVRQTDAHALEVWPTFTRLEAELDRQLWHLDEPYASTSIFSQWCVFGAAAGAGLKVMLDGQGSDEQLAGYGGVEASLYAGLLRRGSVVRLAEEAFAFRSRHGRFPLGQLILASRNVVPSLDYLLPTRLRVEPRPPQWLRLESPSAPRIGAARDLEAHLRAQLLDNSLPGLLRYEDRNSMAWSIESRVPFLDYRLVEYLSSLPAHWKSARGETKVALRAAMRGILPEAVRTRRDKMGFVTPEEVWVRGEASAWFRRSVRDTIDAAPDVIDADSAINELEEIIAGRRPFSHIPWRISCFGRWLSISRGDQVSAAAPLAVA
jgi:asparagine synthase (glutamine-hydrolysing)